MENTNEIKVGNFTVAKSELSGTQQEAIDKFPHVDARIIAQAWTEANPRQKGSAKVETKKRSKTKI